MHQDSNVDFFMLLYMCLICKKMLRKPIQTIKGHRFCRDCIMSKAKPSDRCLLCVEDGIPEHKDCFKLDHAGLFRDKGAENDIKKFPAECRQCGCQATYDEIKKFHIDMPCTRRNCCFF